MGMGATLIILYGQPTRSVNVTGRGKGMCAAGIISGRGSCRGCSFDAVHHSQENAFGRVNNLQQLENSTSAE